MTRVIHLPRGKRPPKEPRTVVLEVTTKGGYSFESHDLLPPLSKKSLAFNANERKQVSRKGQQWEVDAWINEYMQHPDIDVIYVIGYDHTLSKQ